MFIKENVNPKGKKTCDCTTRAITKASGLSYETVFNKQCEVMLKKGYFVNDTKNCMLVLKELGFREVKLGVPKKGDKRPTVTDIAKLSRNKRIVCSLAGHYVACVNGNIYDIWDCSDYAVYKYFVK